MTKTPSRDEWRLWYGQKTWKALRATQLHQEPLCKMCIDEGVTKAGDVVDHIVPHKGDWALFSDRKNLQTLCKHHHDSDKQIIENGNNPKARIGDDGWPIGPVLPKRASRHH